MSIHIHETAIVSDKAIIADNVKIGPFCIIGPQVSIGAGTVLESHVTLDGDTTIGENNYIYSFVSIGKMPQDIDYLNEHTKITIGNNNKIREFVTIHRGTEDKFETKIENNCLIMAYVHIGNDCTIESNCILGNNVTLTGHVYVETNAIISALTPVYENVRIGCHAMVGGASYVFQDILPFTLAEGVKANSAFINMVGLRRRGFSEDEIRNLKEAYKIIFKRGNKLEEAIRQMQEKFPDDKNIKHMIQFIRESKRGIAR